MTTAPYDADAFPPFAVTVDLVVLTVRDDALQVLLVTRGEEPFAGRQALPGGFVRPDEDLARAASRELTEETGVRRIPAHLEQLGTYGAPDRDPRMRVVSVAYLVMAPRLPDPKPGGDAAAAAWVPVADVLPTDAASRPADRPDPGGTARGLAFDHGQILRDGVERARAKLEYTALGTAFCPSEFTVSELRHVYEAVWGVPIDPRNFHRKVTSTPGLLENTGHTLIDGPGRPATLYRRGRTTQLMPPITRDAQP